MDRPTLPAVHPYGAGLLDPENPMYERLRRRAKSPRRPRGIDKAWWFGADRTYRREHYWCCVASAYYCPFCGKLDWNQDDGCAHPATLAPAPAPAAGREGEG